MTYADPLETAVLTVSQLSRAIRNLLEGEFRFIRVSGEIANLSRPYSGHSYFTLKDEGAQLRAVLFKGQQRFQARELQDGQQVLCYGRISVYEPRGDYQLIVDTIDFKGAGLLQLQFEELKKRLAAEGLFAESRKKPIPKFPRKITIITSPSGAAIHDFLKIWRTRKWNAHIQIYPVRVQGAGAADEIAQAIIRVNKMVATELIVLCRGGGSLEDLWAFNEECVARAIADSSVPVVSAIGHEIDFTIADFCADMRAPTPTGAAEQIIPDTRQLTRQVLFLKKQLISLIRARLEAASRRVAHSRRFLGDMEMTLAHFSLRIDHAASRLTHTMEGLLQGQTLRLERVLSRLQHQSPMARISLQRQRLGHAKDSLTHRMQSLLQQKSAHLAAQAALLDTVSPLATLARGYAIAKKKYPEKNQEGILTSSSQVQPGDQIEVLLHSGSVECEINKVNTPAMISS